MSDSTMYTVILLYPDYATASYGETWVGHVTASNLWTAVSLARNDATIANKGVINEPEDFALVAIFEGKHWDQSNRWIAGKAI